jgi:hypothetical protein
MQAVAAWAAAGWEEEAGWVAAASGEAARAAAEMAAGGATAEGGCGRGGAFVCQQAVLQLLTCICRALRFRFGKLASCWHQQAPTWGAAAAAGWETAAAGCGSQGR